jgi:protein TonB
MMVTVNSSGQVLSVEIIQGSGRVELDKRAQAIVLSAGPFSVFNTTLKSKADQIALVSKFIFSSDGTLNTQLQPIESMSQ